MIAVCRLGVAADALRLLLQPPSGVGTGVAPETELQIEAGMLMWSCIAVSVLYMRFSITSTTTRTTIIPSFTASLLMVLTEDFPAGCQLLRSVPSSVESLVALAQSPITTAPLRVTVVGIDKWGRFAIMKLYFRSGVEALFFWESVWFVFESFHLISCNNKNNIPPIWYYIILLPGYNTFCNQAFYTTCICTMLVSVTRC